VTAHRHNATHRPPPSVVRLLTSDDRAHGDALPNVPPSTQHFLPTTLHTLRVPAWLDLDPNDLAHIHRRLPTQRVRGRSLFRSIEKLSDPNEVTESQVADSQCLPFTSAQGLLDFKESPKALVTKLEPFLGLSLCKDRPSCSIR
jgi:hypothetical protein